MADPIKIRATLNNGMVDLRVLMTHPMESGQRRDAQSNQLIPAHYIERAQIALNGKLLIDAELGTAVAKNPVFAFTFRGAKVGDIVTVSWIDNTGDRRSDETRVKTADR